jgi:protein-L-isoaspartate O-methyltransferase
LKLLMLLRKQPIDEAELAAAPGARAAVDQLRAAHVLTTAADAQGILAPFLDGELVRPAMNPAVVYRQRDGQTKTMRLRNADRCLSPRTVAPPDLVEESIPHPAAALLAEATGATTLAAAITRLPAEHRHANAVLQAIDRLTQPQRQLLRIRPVGDRTGIRYHYLNQSFLRSPQDEFTATQYYRSAVDDAHWNFDWIEPTVNHAFRHPTTALHMQSYGERFCSAALTESRLLAQRDGGVVDVLEVGGGIGSFARAFILRAQQLLGPGRLRYTILDCSRQLAAAQERNLAGIGCHVRFVRGDACELALGEERFDLIIANEMIADLPVARTSSLTVELRARLGIDELASAAVDPWIHTGTLAFVEQIAARLRPTGAAVLTEYGSLDGLPRQVTHLNHSEYSTHFAPLLGHARRLGLGARLVPLPQFLDVRDDADMMCAQQEHILCLNRLLARRKLAMPYAAFCRPELERQFGAALQELGVLPLAYAPMKQGLHFGPALRQFHALVLSVAATRVEAA